MYLVYAIMFVFLNYTLGPRTLRSIKKEDSYWKSDNCNKLVVGIK